ESRWRGGRRSRRHGYGLWSRSRACDPRARPSRPQPCGRLPFPGGEDALTQPELEVVHVSLGHGIEELQDFAMAERGKGFGACWLGHAGSFVVMVRDRLGVVIETYRWSVRDSSEVTRSTSGRSGPVLWSRACRAG